MASRCVARAVMPQDKVVAVQYDSTFRSELSPHMIVLQKSLIKQDGTVTVTISHIFLSTFSFLLFFKAQTLKADLKHLYFQSWLLSFSAMKG